MSYVLSDDGTIIIDFTGNPTVINNIPSSVTSIDAYAFDSCSTLSSITIPSSVTNIGEGAFFRCSGLTSVSLSSSLTVIPRSAFAGCSSLASITIPSSVTIIGYNAFAACSSLISITIPSSVRYICDSVFYNCTYLQTASYYSATRIGYEMTTNTEDYPVFPPSTVVTIIDNGTPPSQDDYILYNNGTAIYRYRGSSDNINIPSSITTIGNQAFINCSFIKSITIPSSVTSIGESAFSGCTGLFLIQIPATVTTILDLAFNNCGNLTIYYYEGTTLGADVFPTTATVIIIPNTTTTTTTQAPTTTTQAPTTTTQAPTTTTQAPTTTTQAPTTTTQAPTTTTTTHAPTTTTTTQSPLQNKANTYTTTPSQATADLNSGTNQSSTLASALLAGVYSAIASSNLAGTSVTLSNTDGSNLLTALNVTASLPVIVSVPNSLNVIPAPTTTSGSYYIPISKNVSGSYTISGTTDTISSDGQGGQFFNGTRLTAPSTITLSTGVVMNISYLGSIVMTPNTNVPCFPKGTRIATASGYVPVETLESGDLVLTSDSRQVPIRVYSRTLVATEQTAPYLIPKNSLGLNQPSTDLRLSPLHAFQLKKGLWQIPMYAAKSSDKIQQYDIGSTVTYYHVECPNFFTDNLLVDGCVVESYGSKQVSNIKTLYKYNSSLKGFTRASPVKSLTCV
jgi:hypothetical protein